MTFSKVEQQRHQFFNCMMVIEGETYMSNDQMFLNSERGVKRLPFFVGMHELSEQMYAYETKLHAQFALFHVLLAKLKKTTAELMFLCDHDIAFVKPTEMYAMNSHGGKIRSFTYLFALTFARRVACWHSTLTK